MEYLLAFAKHIPSGTTSDAVMKKLIQPATLPVCMISTRGALLCLSHCSHCCLQFGTRWADVDALIPAACVGAPNFFIRHA